jgi:hypothetical protein
MDWSPPPRNAGKIDWTDEMLDELRAGVRNGDGFSRIGSRINVSDRYCRDKARELGLASPRRRQRWEDAAWEA